ncbi:MAG: leucyl aminopeptidase [Arenimonas sp.]|uniref:leucyl aminopeptidase n=1 Tax=Arenimonas sp. TaxID=1872635 RepID=UPI0025C3CE44|nr:leucyl aminopeptidase [Arenimonas sp.]MBW8368241.1 leucyl aminopeptidase [Arenimonas sp.]
MNRFASLSAVIVAIVAFAAPSPADAQRKLEFAPYAVPAEGAVAVVVRQGAPMEGAFAEVDRVSGGALQRAVAAAGFIGDRGVMLNLPGVGPYQQVVLVGVGSEAASPRLLEDVGGLVGQAAALSGAPRIELLWPGTDIAMAGGHLAMGASLGQYTFRNYRTPRPGAPVLGQGELVLRVADAEGARRAWTAQWQPVAEGVRFARDLVTEPANTIYPESFVERTREAFRDVPGVSIEVLDVPAMQALGMGSLLAVGQGSQRPPRLLVVRYRGGGRDEAPVAFVGKGITFDTGGISIKPSLNLWQMKYDMTGAASVTGAVLALAKRGARVNAIAVAALAENMPSGTATRPGDVIRTMSGKTYEVMSTDAEGRMVLVDAIWFVQQRDRPRVVIDVATLTGSQVTALGDEYGGLFTRDEALAANLLAAGAASGEDLWRLPLHPSYAKDLESPIADLRNGGSTARAGAGVGAFFIGSWVQEGVAWAHLDIASMAWRDLPVLPTVPLGASGFGVRLLDRYVRDHVETPAP